MMRNYLLSRVNSSRVFNYRSFSSRSSVNYNNVSFSKEVEFALENNQPVVALESTIISHGMPWPDNLDCAKQVEQIVRDGGAIPATIAILDGTLKIGLEEQDLHKLAQLGTQVQKCSRRDMAVVMGGKKDGATTVSGTMLAAEIAGIKVFATGGIGGVHRGAFNGDEPTLDVSADLTELGRTPVCVVCAGVKSILDVGRTLEYLETVGVSVFTMGSKNFPDFFTTDSGYASPFTADSANEIAQVIHANNQLNLNSGMVVAVPNQSPMSPDEVQNAIQLALIESQDVGVTGRDVTPFLLKRVNELTGGDSLVSNVALVKNNARVATEIAVEYSRVENTSTTKENVSETAIEDDASTEQLHMENVVAKHHFITNPTGNIVVAGGSCVDTQAKGDIVTASSTAGHVTESYGGVARNIAECVAKLSNVTNNTPPLLLSCVGNDRNGDDLYLHCEAVGIDTSLLQRIQGRTANYVSMLNKDGSLLAAVADMEILEKLSPDIIKGCEPHFAAAPIAVVDANLTVPSLQTICEICEAYKTPILFEPVSVVKIRKIVKLLNYITYLKPNEDELVELYNLLTSKRTTDVVEMAKLVAGRMLYQKDDTYGGTDITKHVIVTRGQHTVIHVQATKAHDEIEYVVSKIPVELLSPDEIVNVTGAGDTFVGVLAWGLASNVDVDEILQKSCKAATLSLRTSDAIASDLFKIVC